MSNIRTSLIYFPSDAGRSFPGINRNDEQAGKVMGGLIFKDNLRGGRFFDINS